MGRIPSRFKLTTRSVKIPEPLRLEVDQLAQQSDLTFSFLVRYGLKLAIAQIKDKGAIEL